MEDKMHWLPTSIGMAVLTCLFGGIVIGIYPGWDLVGSFLDRNVKINLNENAPAWVQAVGSIVTIWMAMFVIRYQLGEERKRSRAAAAAIINTFAGTLGSFESRFPRNGNRSLWNFKTMKALLLAEMARADAIPLDCLSPTEQRGIFALRLSAFQLVEGLNFAEPAIEVVAGNQYVVNEAYEFFLGVIQDANIAYHNGRALLGAQLNAPKQA